MATKNEKIVHVTDATFKTEVLDQKGPVLVDFWATWCGPCRQAAPVLDELSQTYPDALRIAKVDIDHEVNTAANYGIQSIPTFLIFKDGQPVGKLVGFGGKKSMFDFVQKSMS